MQFDFESVVDRTGTGSLKWQRYDGRDVVSMWLADMDFRSPSCVDDALRRRVEHGVYGYTEPYKEVEDAVLNYLKRTHGYEAQREWILWMPGLVPALNTAARAFGWEDGSIMMCTPVYPPFLTAPEWQGAGKITVPLRREGDRYSFDWDAMEEAVRPETKAFYLCNPHNPVGRAFSREELLRFADFCERHNLVIVSDEIHCDLLLDPEIRHVCTATLSPEIARRTITLMAPSKTYNLPGLACSFILIEDKGLRTQFRRASRGLITEVNCMGYEGCRAAYDEGGPWLDALLETLRRHYHIVREFVRDEMPLISMAEMEATYLAWLDVRALKLDHPGDFFLSHGVGLGDGVNFGVPGFVRLTFACPEKQLREGLRRIKQAYDVAIA